MWTKPVQHRLRDAKEAARVWAPLVLLAAAVSLAAVLILADCTCAFAQVAPESAEGISEGVYARQPAGEPERAIRRHDEGIGGDQ